MKLTRMSVMNVLIFMASVIRDNTSPVFIRSKNDWGKPSICLQYPNISFALSSSFIRIAIFPLVKAKAKANESNRKIPIVFSLCSDPL